MQIAAKRVPRFSAGAELKKAVVIEVNQPHPHTRRRRGKTDAIDAELAARHALAHPTPVIPKQTTGIVSRSASCASPARAP